MLWDPANPLGTPGIRETLVAARALGLQLRSQEVRTPDDVERAFVEIAGGQADALVVDLPTPASPLLSRIVDLAANRRLPAMYASREFADAGGLLAYGPSLGDLYARAAGYVDRLLKGA